MAAGHPQRRVGSVRSCPPAAHRSDGSLARQLHALADGSFGPSRETRPQFAPVPPTDDARGYESPDHVPDAWMPDRLAEIRGFQPEGARLGHQGPDQGYALKLARSFDDRIRLQPGERRDDAVGGCLGIALRRASM